MIKMSNCQGRVTPTGAMRTIFAGAFLIAFLSSTSVPAMAQDADLVVFNGRIVAVDEKPLLKRGPSPYAGNVFEAMAVRDEAIIAMGNNNEILKLAGPETQRLDLEGRMVLPGFIDAHRHTTGYVPSDFPEVDGLQIPPQVNIERTKKAVEEAIKKRIQEIEPGEWMIINPTGRVARDMILFSDINRAELDRWAPDHPLMLHESGSGPSSQILFNSKGREVIEKELPVFKKFTDHDLKGDGVNLSSLIVKDVMLKGRDKDYAKSLKKVMLSTTLPLGFTTIGTRLTRTVINALVILDRAGEMPIRYGWFYGDGSFYNPEGFFKRFPEISGVGSAYLWNLGVGEEVIDSPSTGLCTPARVINPVLADRFARSGVDTCRINHPVMRAHVKDQIQYGRGVEYHGTDGTIDIILEIIDEIREETGMTVEEIREKRITLDHLFIVRPDQIPKLVEYGMVMAVSPGFLSANMNPTANYNVLQNYGEQWMKYHIPAKSLMDAGAITVFAEYRRPFQAIKMMVTREACFSPRLPEQGKMGVETCKTLGPEQAINRITALKMTTQWAAYYMLKENQIGSLEVGKWADFVVIDKDYFAVSGKGIQDINVLLTVIGGKVAYASPDYGPIDRALFKGPEYFREAQLSN